MSGFITRLKKKEKKGGFYSIKEFCTILAGGTQHVVNNASPGVDSRGRVSLKIDLFP